jgi:hypothetical protein
MWLRDQKDKEEMDKMPLDANNSVGTPILMAAAPQK